MTYRNDLEAAHCRINQLEKKLKDTKEEKKRKKMGEPSWLSRNKNHIKTFAKWFAIIGILGSMTTGSIFGIVRCNAQLNNRERKFLAICKVISPKNSGGHKVVNEMACNGENYPHYCYYYTKEHLNGIVVLTKEHKTLIPLNVIYQPENQHLFKKEKKDD